MIGREIYARPHDLVAVAFGMDPHKDAALHQNTIRATEPEEIGKKGSASCLRR